MTDLNELKRKAEAAADEFGAYDPGEAEIEFMSAVTPALVLELFAENERLARSLTFTEQWYAARLERLTDLGKAKGCWEEMAAIIANGTVSPNDPPLYARQLVRANHRANTAERERDQLRAEARLTEDSLGHTLAEVADLRAEVRALRGAMHEVMGQVDGNIRELARDLVNRLSGLSNGANPNDLYVYCDAIDRAISVAMGNGERADG